MSNFGEILKKLRKKAGMTQMELAVKLRISKTSVAYYEQSARFPPG